MPWGASGPVGAGRSRITNLGWRLDERALPAVSYPQSLGLDWRELVELVQPLAASPDLVGVSVADLNPDLDPDGQHARRTVDALAEILA